MTKTPTINTAPSTLTDFESRLMANVATGEALFDARRPLSHCECSDQEHGWKGRAAKPAQLELSERIAAILSRSPALALLVLALCVVACGPSMGEGVELELELDSCAPPPISEPSCPITVSVEGLPGLACTGPCSGGTDQECAVFGGAEMVCGFPAMLCGDPCNPQCDPCEDSECDGCAPGSTCEALPANPSRGLCTFAAPDPRR